MKPLRGWKDEMKEKIKYIQQDLYPEYFTCSQNWEKQIHRKTGHMTQMGIH